MDLTLWCGVIASKAAGSVHQRPYSGHGTMKLTRQARWIITLGILHRMLGDNVEPGAAEVVLLRTSDCCCIFLRHMANHNSKAECMKKMHEQGAGKHNIVY
jgi:hypothetical protein